MVEAGRKVAAADHAFSPVYRKTHRAPGPKKGQVVNLRLRSPFMMFDDDSDSLARGIWSGNESEKLLRSKTRRYGDFGTTVDPFAFLWRGLFCASRFWVIARRAKDRSPRTSFTYISSTRDETLQIRTSDLSYLETSTSSTPLPVFLRRPRTDTLLLRRPLIEKVVPLPVDDDIFEAFSKSIDLRPLPFKKTADSFKFYETHFPLILSMITKDDERISNPNKRSRTPDSPMTIMIQRQRLLNQRLVDLDCMMVDMENETEDCLFVTELHDPVFNPTTWKWNKVDVGALRRRYTIDASLQNM